MRRQAFYTSCSPEPDAVAIPVIAIVGRPNVGKSTLFNRLAGERIAVVSDIAGTTRDRVSADAKWEDERYILVDTAGIEGNSEDIFWPDMQSQVLKALDEADTLIFVTDTHEGLTTADRDAANLIRRYHKPVILAANKADNIEREQDAVEAYELDLGDPIPISAYHNIGISDLMEAVMKTVVGEEEEEFGRDVRISIVGRPNVGKSALLNAITGEERALVSDIPGTTTSGSSTQPDSDVAAKPNRASRNSVRCGPFRLSNDHTQR